VRQGSSSTSARTRRRLGRWVALLIAALSQGPALAVPGTTLQPGAHARRLVAVGDVHGNDEGFVAILRRAGLVDQANHWTGITATFVQTGDVTDRGLGVRAALDLLMTLEREAPRTGGRVAALLGNHELMNLLGETRDVNPGLYFAFTDDESERRREAGWTAYARLAAAQKTAAGTLPPPYHLTREAWMAAHPRGYLEYREAFGPRGKYGKWLREKDVAVAVDGTLFMHAGPSLESTPRRVDDLNTVVHRELARFDRFVQDLVDRKLALPSFTLREIIDAAANQIRIANEFVDAQRVDREAPRPALGFDELREAEAIVDIGTWSLLAPQGPMWIRGYATLPETEAPTVAAALGSYGVTRLVVGHTPQRTITSRFNGTVFLIDTGMLASVYKGEPSALELRGDRATAFYTDRQEELTRTPIGAQDGTSSIRNRSRAR
jgi:hypothetical protein